MLARFIPLVRASLLGAVVGACSLYTLYLSLAVVIYFISPSDHPFARAGHLGLSALPLAIAGGVIAGPFFFFRSSPAEPLRRAGRVCAAGALSLLFALCLRGAQCGYFALTVLRPSFPLGSPASQVVERLGKPKFDISGAEAVTHAKAVRPRLQGVGRVLLYFEGRGALHRSLYFDESGRLLADEQGEIYY